MPRIKKHKELAEYILKVNSYTRNDDMALWFKALELNGVNIPTELQWEIRTSGVNFKTLIRVRQELQRKGLYEPTNDETKKRRWKLEQEFTENYSQN